MLVFGRLVLIILLYKYVASSLWRHKTKQHVRLSDIITVHKDASLSSCQVKCNLQQDCDKIGTDQNIELGMIANCYLLNRKDYSDVRRSVLSPNIVTKEIYVYEKHDLCKTSKCRDDQKCVITGARYICVCTNGRKTKDCKLPLSCNVIRQLNPNAHSGFYRINLSKPVSVYCDMNIDTNGWMLIANITLPNPIPSVEARKLSSLQSLSNDIGQLNQVITGRFRFNPVRLADFDASFQYIHFYCKRPGGRTISITTVTKNVLDYFMLKTNSKIAACNSFKRLPADNSRLTARCSQWVYSKWAGLSSDANRLYAFPFYISGRYHYGIRDIRYECDNYGGSNAGVWKIYVR